MAATYIAGAGGNVTPATGFALKFKSWSLDIVANTADFSNWDSVWENSLFTFGTATGSFEGHPQFDDSNLMPVPDSGGNVDIASFSGSTTLTATTGCTLSGTFVYTGVSFTRDNESEMVVSGDLKLNGTLAITWDETA